VGNEGWLEHKAPFVVAPGTVLQPFYKRTKSVTSPEMKDITNSRTSRYCLITQEADTDGELETRLYKGDVIPTTTGGAQVVFDDVECLKQLSPINATTTSPTTELRKRKSNTEQRKTPSKKSAAEIGDLCSTGIEGHFTKKQRL
jgi:kinesin family protein 23